MTEEVDSTRRPTMFDVARLAGVSHTTVSRFMAHDPQIKQVNRERIEAAIAELEYRPNVVARSMRMRRTGLLAVILPANINGFGSARIVSAVTSTAHLAGYEVEVYNVAGGMAARTKRALELADSKSVEGVLSLTDLLDDDYSNSRTGGVPVIVSSVYDDLLQGNGVLIDAAPIAEIMDHLHSIGHRRFFWVGGPTGHPPSAERKAEYRRGIERLSAVSLGTAHGDWSGKTGENAVAGLAEDCGVTAILCANDTLAAGAIKAAVTRGWNIPGDVSITGWDNNAVGEYLPPGLTTVHVDHDLLGSASMRRLIAAVRNEPAEPEDLTHLNTVIWRGSVGPAATR
ncbi:LacI family DNA-binding transcriptional regulator [Rathayibacter sp. VKM Ac-2835]|uniref:LacI family DNA-binding transcriptional regulator n=1 Tax=Rathayibacter sp. VKM Ac-2835 TaxID=2739043 RepID=UPI0015638CCD|nr:LacI family DNA-binding transcriptional regulator [Rathayibacter sp. VKM Ac-2835]NRG43035.1 LacI family DNA-binding transcriptional regulator [Rathayibacter sp. VKM Ac-2835]